MAPWRPRLLKGDEPIYARLLRAMETDIASGRLGPGTRLPPQREVAHALSISVGAVTRAYDELARRGLIDAHVGKGSFVSRATQEPSAGVIDLASNTPPLGPARAALAAMLSGPAGRQLLLGGLKYAPPGGDARDRQAGCIWLAGSTNLYAPDARRLLCTSGAQSGLAVALATLMKPGDALLCEAATYAAIKPLVRQMGGTLQGVALDAEGMRPEALEKAARMSGARALYVTPTLQNPTARTMSEGRRRDIVRIANKCDLAVIEDNVYAYYRENTPAPFATLAPERTFHVSSLSKCVAPGLRVGYLVAPDEARFEQAVQHAFAQTISAPSLGLAIATHWLESQEAFDIAKANRGELRARTQMAAKALGRHVAAPGSEASLHLWAPMTPLEAERVYSGALQAGVQLTGPRAHEVSADAPSGLRICIGAAADRPALSKALAVLARLAEEKSKPVEASII